MIRLLKIVVFGFTGTYWGSLAGVLFMNGSYTDAAFSAALGVFLLAASVVLATGNY